MDRNDQIKQSFSNHPSQGSQGSGQASMMSCGLQNVGSNERILSAVAGGLCLGHSLWGRVFPRPMSLLVGASLIYRAVTGHCAMYESLGLNTADDESRGSGALAHQHSSPMRAGSTGDVALAATGELSPNESHAQHSSPASGTHH